MSDNRKKHLSFTVTFWSYRVSFFDGLHFLEDGLLLMFALALVIQTLGFAEMLIAFKVHGLKASCKYSAPLTGDLRLFFSKSTPLQICLLFAYPPFIYG